MPSSTPDPQRPAEQHRRDRNAHRAPSDAPRLSSQYADIALPAVAAAAPYVRAEPRAAPRRATAFDPRFEASV
jgi:hypothetical protein